MLLPQTFLGRESWRAEGQRESSEKQSKQVPY